MSKFVDFVRDYRECNHKIEEIEKNARRAAEDISDEFFNSHPVAGHLLTAGVVTIFLGLCAAPMIIAYAYEKHEEKSLKKEEKIEELIEVE